MSWAALPAPPGNAGASPKGCLSKSQGNPKSCGFRPQTRQGIWLSSLCHPAEMPTVALELPKPRSDPELPPRALPLPPPPSRKAPLTRGSFLSPPGGSQAVQGRAPHPGRLRIGASLVLTILGDRWPGGWAGRERPLLLVKMTLKSTSPPSQVVSGVSARDAVRVFGHSASLEG